MTANSVCSGCGAQLRWAITEKARKALPIDLEPVEGGNIEIDQRMHGGDVARIVKAEPTVKRFVAHFTTCPQASLFRSPE